MFNQYVLPQGNTAVQIYDQVGFLGTDGVHRAPGWLNHPDTTAADIAATGARIYHPNTVPAPEGKTWVRSDIVLDEATGEYTETPVYTDMDKDAFVTQRLLEVQQHKADCLKSMKYTVNGTVYDITLGVQDQVNVQIKLGIMQQMPAGATATWEVVNNVFVQWGAADLGALLQAGVAHIQGCYDNASRLVDLINAAKTPADVAAVDVNTGWPD